MNRLCSHPLQAVSGAAVLLLSANLAWGDGEKVLLVIRTGPDISLEVLREAVGNTLQKLEPKPMFNGRPVIDGEPDVQTISAVEYQAYQRLENPDAVPSPLPSTRKDNLEVRQLPAAQPTWEFNLLGMIPQEISRLEVTYEDAPTRAVALTPTKNREDPLTITQFGSYVLKPPANKRPVKYVAYIRELGSKDDRKMEGDWPQGDNYYLIRLNGFRGDRNQFSATIKDSNKIGGTALDAFNIKSDVTLGIGEAGATDDEQEEETIEGNKLYVNVPRLRRDDAARAYMLFPLSEKEAEEKLVELNKFTPNGLSKEIRQANPIPKEQPVVITPATKPLWIELPRVEKTGAERGLRPGSFGRVISLASPQAGGVKPGDYKELLDQFPQAYRIVVYEFDDGKIRNALYYKRSPTQKKRTLANGGPMTVWAVQLARLAAEPPKPRDGKK